MDYRSRNTRRIDKAFARITKEAEDKSFNAISKGTEEGYDAAIKAHHQYRHEFHLKVKGDYGYGVARNGTAEIVEIKDGKVELLDTAEKAIPQHLKKCPKRGVLGVVSAGMESLPYDSAWEESIMKVAFGKAVQKARDEFDK